MKSAWQAQVKQWQAENIGRFITKKEFPMIFKVAWEKVQLMKTRQMVSSVQDSSRSHPKGLI